MRHNLHLRAEESKKQCYIYVGDSLKYDPTWVKQLPSYDSYVKSNGIVNKKFVQPYRVLEETNSADCLKSLTQSISGRHLEQARDAIKNKRRSLNYESKGLNKYLNNN